MKVGDMDDTKITNYHQGIRDKLSDLKSISAGLGVDDVVFDRMDDLLLDSCASIKLKPFTVQINQGRVGVKWTTSNGYVSVLFGPNDTWEWEACNHIVQPHRDGGDSGYEVTYKHSGECSYVINGTHYYSLPEEVEKMISVPDEFDSVYDPQLSKWEYDVVWVTNKWDGMLSGYLRTGGKLHYFDIIDETYFERRRMFAVYQLSRLERLVAWYSYRWWNVVLSSTTAWKLHQWVNKFKTRNTPNRHHEMQAKFKQTHAVVGYFER